MVKRKIGAAPTLPPAPWDFGPTTLAVLGDVPVIVAAFRRHLKSNKGDMEAVLAGDRPVSLADAGGNLKRQAKMAAARRARAVSVAAAWMHANGLTVHIESADQVDDAGRKVNPNGVRRAVRLSVAETYRRQGHLTVRQADAAGELLKAWERTQRSAPAIRKVQVDTSPKPDANIAIMVDRVGRYHSIAQMIPPKYRAYVLHVARDDRFLNAMPGYRDGVYMDRLRTGLDGLADAMGR